MTVILVWNVRGIGNENACEKVYNMRKEHKFKIMVLIEPKVQLNERRYLKRFNYDRVFANRSGKSGCSWTLISKLRS